MRMSTIEVHRDQHTGRVLRVHVIDDHGIIVGSLPCTRVELDSQGDGTGEFRLSMNHNHVRFVTV